MDMSDLVGGVLELLGVAAFTLLGRRIIVAVGKRLPGFEPDVCFDGAEEMRMAEARVGDEFGAFEVVEVPNWHDETLPNLPVAGAPLNAKASDELAAILKRMGVR